MLYFILFLLYLIIYLFPYCDNQLSGDCVQHDDVIWFLILFDKCYFSITIVYIFFFPWRPVSPATAWRRLAWWVYIILLFYCVLLYSISDLLLIYFPTPTTISLPTASSNMILFDFWYEFVVFLVSYFLLSIYLFYIYIYKYIYIYVFIFSSWWISLWRWRLAWWFHWFLILSCFISYLSIYLLICLFIYLFP